MKNVLLTGASRGLGLQICKTLLESGQYRVYATSRTKSQEIEILLKTFSGRLFYKAEDLGDAIAAKNALFADDFIAHNIPLSGFVNNAAIAYDDLVSNLDIARTSDMFAVNVFTPMLLAKYAVRNMILNKVGGSIVHISSISAHTGYKGLAMYAATKGAIEAFSKSTAREWGQRGIRSNCVVCGFMQTDMGASLNNEQKEKIYKRTALKEPTSPQSVAQTVGFLLGENSKSITGQNLFVDSGTI
ncbi:MAG: SDR family oxidoreductase [Opitutales bacterium]|nr:SDR family oxidoreductase [Opitutales bacterium]